MTEKEKRQELLARAKELGLSFPNNVTTGKLEDMIREKEDELVIAEGLEPTEDELLEAPDADELEEAKAESEAEMRERLEAEYAKKLEGKVAELKLTQEMNSGNGAGGVPSQGLLKLKAMKEATKLVRCVITNRNPLKQSWDGEIFTVSNDLIGMQRKFVPFSLEEGYHLPQIIVNTLKDKECTIFVNAKTKNGEKVKVGKLIREYAIEILPPLSDRELQELAAAQTARGALDEE